MNVTRLTRTWPYGTTRRAVVVVANYRPDGLFVTEPSGQLLKDELGEMHILIGEGCCDYGAKDGGAGVLTFTQGGPTGGFWKFKKDDS